MSKPAPHNLGVYEARVYEMVEFAGQKYGLAAEEATILLSTLLPTDPYPPAWLICDSKNHSFWEDLAFGLREFGVEVRSLHALRLRPPYFANRAVYMALNQRNRPAVWTDSATDRPAARPSMRHRYYDLAAQCLRLSVTPDPFRAPHPNTRVDLTYFLRRVLEDRGLAITPAPTNDRLARIVAILHKTNPELSDLHVLSRNAGILAASHAALFGRTWPEEADHRALYRVLRDSMRKWNRDILSVIVAMQGLVHVRDIADYVRMEQSVVSRECNRMYRIGLLVRPTRQNKQLFMVHPDLEADVKAFLQGTYRWW